MAVKGIKNKYISLAEAAKTSPYSQEYLSLLARQGKLQAKKFGRNWYIAPEALNEYLTDQGIKIVLPKHLFNTSYKGKITKAFFPTLAQFPQEPIDLSGALGGEEKEKTEEPTRDAERIEAGSSQSSAADLGGEIKKEKILQPSLIKTMEKDIVALGGKELRDKPIIFKKITSQLGRIFYKREGIKAPEKAPQVVPEKAPEVPVAEERPKIIEKPTIEKKEVPMLAAPIAAPRVEKEKPAPPWRGGEIPVEEKVLERLLQAIEARMPVGITAKLGRLNGAANQYFRSTPKAILVSIIAIIIILLLVGGVSFGNLDKAAIAINNFFKDAVTLQGSRPGTHANEVLLLDKNGNISIYGHIETKGQLRSWVEQGVAPVVVVSTTTVENLSADYLDNLSSQEFTLAFVTKNGNITYENVYLEGDVAVGKTLLVKGAAKLLDSLFVYGTLGAFGGIDTAGANLNLGSGTIVTTNQNLIPNLNADLLDSMHASDFDLHFVTSQGSNTFNDISVGGLNVSGFFGQYGSFRIGGGEREVGLIDTKNWSISTAGHLSTKGGIKTDYYLTAGGLAKFTGTPGASISSATVYINPTSANSNAVLLGLAVNGTEKLRVDAEGDLTVAGTTLISGASTFSGNVVLSSPANLTLNAGDLIVNKLATSSNVSAQATSSSSGSLTANTYYYVVTVLNDNGETSSSTEVSAVVDGVTTNAVSLSWSAVSGASGYRVYGRTQGAQDQYWQTTATSLIDTGTSGTAAAVPTSNTTGGNGTFYSGLSILGTTISRSILPETASYYSLGSTAYPWLNVFTDNLKAASTTFSGNITMADDKWIGLGDSAGRLVFDDQAPDYLTIQDARLGMATTTPRYLLDVWGDIGFGTSTATSSTEIVPAFFVDSGDGPKIGIGTTTLAGLLTVGTTTPALVVSPVSYVGIGTSTPSTNLAVVGNIMGSGNMVLYGEVTSTIAYSLVVDANTLFVDAYDNRVGVNTATPWYGLDVVGTGKFSTSLDVAGNATTTGTSLTFAEAGNITTGAASTWKTTAGNLTITAEAGHLIATGTDVRIVASTGDISATSSNAIYLATNNTERIRILQSGHVGIATTSPRYTLDVWGDLAIGTSTGVSAPMNYPLLYVNSGEGGSSNGVGMGTTTLFGLLTVGTSTPALVVAPNAKVGIGTTTPEEALHVVGNILGSGNLTIAGNLMPTAPQTKDIGSAAIDWQNIYTANIYADNLYGTGDIAQIDAETLTINADATADATSTLRFYRGVDTPHALLNWDAGYDRFNLNFPLYLSGTGDISAAGALNFTGNAASTWKTTAGNLTITSEAGHLIATGTDVRMVASTGDISATSSNAIYLATNNKERLRINNNGYVGIGTTTLAGLFTVGTTTPALVVSPLSYVGIGTSTPSTNLAVAGNIMGSGNLVIYSANVTSTFAGAVQAANIRLTGGAVNNYVLTSDVNGFGNWMSLNTLAPNSWQYIGPNAIRPTSTVGIIVSASSTFTGDLSIMGNATTTGNFAAGSNLYVYQGGNVGIGTSGPQEKLVLGSGSNFAVEMAVPAGVSGTTIAGTLTAATYYIKVVASDGVGATIGSSEYSTTTAAAQAVRLSWTAPQGAQSYRVYVGTSSGGQDIYFDATTTTYWLSTTTVNQITDTVPSVTTAYVNKTTASGNSWFLGGNIGIATTSPRYKLDVWGDFSVGTSTATNIPILYVDTGTGYGSVGIGTTTPTGLLTVGTSTAALVVTNSGNVGISTTTPSATLAVQGNIMGSGNIVLYGANVTSTFAAGLQAANIRLTQGAVNNYVLTADSNGFANWMSLNTLAPNSWQYIGPNAIRPTSTVGIIVSASSTFAGGATTTFEGGMVVDTNSLYVMADTNMIGIGTTTPSAKLEIFNDTAGQNLLEIGTTTASGLMVMDSSGRVGIASSTPSDKLAVQGNIIGSGNVNFYGAAATTTIGGGLIVGTNTLWVPAGGNVGIGNTGPSSKLTVNGGDFVISSTGAATTTISSATSTLAGGLIVDTSTLYLMSDLNRIGVATTTPRYTLDVWGSLAVGTTTSPIFLADTGATGNTPGITVGADMSVGSLQVASSSGAITLIDMIVEASASAGTEESYSFMIDNSELFKLYAESNGGGGIQNRKILIGTTGTSTVVGIATTTPRYALDVWGDFSVGTSTATNIPILYVDTGNNYGSVGIGTTTPTGLLTVGTSTAALVVTNSGNVGISTTTPSATLAVQGNIMGSGNLVIYGANVTSTFAAGLQAANIRLTGGAVNNHVLTTDSNGFANWQSLATLAPNSWQYVGPNAIRPTSTVGIIVSASSTFAADLSIMGNATTTGNLAAGSNLYVYQSGYVGIATTSPRYLLDVWGSMAIGTSTATTSNAIVPAFLVTSGNGPQVGIGTTTLANNLLTVGTTTAALVVDTLSRVGMATTSPSAQLAVQGNIMGSGNIVLYGTAASSTLKGLIATGLNLSGNGITNAVWNGTNVGLAYGGTGATLTDPNADRIMFWDDSLGQTTWLQVGTNLNLTDTTLSGLNSNWQFIGVNAIRPTSTVGIIVSASSTFAGYVTAGGGFTGNASTADAFKTNPTDCASSETAAYQIDASGNLTCATFWNALSDISLTEGYVIVGNNAGVAMATSTLFVNADNGNVGIGTTGPDTKLAVLGDFDGSSAMPTTNGNKGLLVTKSTGVGSDYGLNDIYGLTFAAQSSDASDYPVSGVFSEVTSLGSYVGGSLHFATHGASDATLLKRMTINSAGQVGIGTAGPSELLTVFSATDPTFQIGTGSATTTISSNVSTFAGGLISQASSTFTGIFNISSSGIHATSTDDINFAFTNRFRIATSTDADILKINSDGGVYLANSMYQDIYGSDDGLVLYLPFSEGMTSSSAATAYDRSPYGNDGTATNMPMPTRNATSGESGWATTTAKCKVPGCMSFDGTDDNISKDSGVNGIGGGSFSVELWLKRDRTATLETFFSLGPTNLVSSFYWQFLANDKVYFSLTLADSSQRTFTSTNVFTDTTSWHHLVIVYPNGAEVFYIDGVQQAGSDGGTATANLPSITTYLKIGVRGRSTTDTEYFNGLIDEVRIYNRALSADEIRAHYLRGTGAGGAVLADKFRVIGTDNNIDFIVNSGDVGIGTSTPSTKLAVAGNIMGSGNAIFYGTATSTFGGPIAQPSGNLTIGSAVGSLLFNPYGGNVGVATTTPSATFAVQGQSYFSATTTIKNGLVVGGNKLFVSEGGNVGIGTAGPAGILHLVSEGEADLFIETNNSGASNFAGIRNRKSRGTKAAPTTVANGDILSFYGVYAYVSTSGYVNTAAIRTIVNGTVTGTAAPTDIHFFAGTNDGNTDEKMRITSSGKVGIGNTGPSSKLTVNGGDIKVSSTGAATTTISSNVSTFAGGIISQASSTFTGDLTVDSDLYASDSLFVDASLGRIGIGTTTLAGLLTVGTTTPALVVDATGRVQMRGAIASESYYEGIDDGLILYLPLSEYYTSSTIAETYDRSQYSNDAVLSGFPMPTAIATSGSGWATSTCKFGSCLNFDGVNDYVDVGTDSSLNITGFPFTIELWVKPSRIPPITEMGLISKYGDTSATRSWKLYFNKNGAAQNLALYTFSADGVAGISNSDIGGGFDFAIDAWYHIVVVLGKTQIITYVNGVEKETTDHSETQLQSVNYPLELGRHNVGNQDELGGFIDEVRIYKRVLSADEARWQYEKGLGTQAPYVNIITGNVGIGTTGPSELLTVFSATDPTLQIGSGSATTTISGLTTATTTIISGLSAGNNAALVVNQAASANSLYIVANGNVGIKTTNPSAPFHVAKDIGTMPTFVAAEIVSVFSNNSAVSDGATIGIVAGTENAAQIAFGDSADYDAGLIGYNNGNDSMSFRAGGAGEAMRINSLNNVGIGTTTPRYKLDVWGDFAVGTSTIYGGANMPLLYVDSGNGAGKIGIATSTPRYSLDIWGSLAVGTTTSPLIYADAGNSLITLGGDMSVGSLQVASSSGAITLIDMIVEASASAGTEESYSFMIDNSELFKLYAESNGGGGIQNRKILIGTTGTSTVVGIATTTPRYALDVWGDFSVGTSTATNIPILYVDTGNNYGSVGIGTTTPTGLLTVGTSTPALVVTSAGNIGIGTTSPSHALEVKGDVFVTGDAPGMAIFGNGSDGDITLSGDTALTSDMHYNSLNLSGYTLSTASYAIFVRGTLNFNGGTIAGTNSANGWLRGTAGGGGADAGCGSSATAGASATRPNAEGTGGTGKSGSCGGAAGGSSAQKTRNPLSISQGGTGGGGGGGGVGTNGGSGGQGGTTVLIFAQTLTGTGTITANGSVGGNSSDGGGGGGGGGGNIIIIYQSDTSSLSTSATGGAAGTGGTGGTASSAGTVIKIANQ